MQLLGYSGVVARLICLVVRVLTDRLMDGWMDGWMD